MGKKFLPLLLILFALISSQFFVHARIQTMIVEILSAEAGIYVNGIWYPKTSFYHMDPIELQIDLTSTSSSQNICLTCTIMDTVGTPVLFMYHKHLMQCIGKETILLNLGLLPSWTKLGEVTLTIAALTKLPIEGGIPYCPPMQLDLEVWWNPADVNRDYQVDFYDAVTVSISYYSTPSSSNWNQHCDIAMPYGTVNIFDVIKVLDDIGEKYNP